MLNDIFIAYCNLSEKGTYIKQLPNGKYKIFSKNTGKSFGPEFKTQQEAKQYDEKRRKAYFAQKGN